MALPTAFSGHYDVVAAAKTPVKGSSRLSGPGRIRGSLRAVGRALHFPVTGTARGIRKATHAHGAA